MPYSKCDPQSYLSTIAMLPCFLSVLIHSSNPNVLLRMTKIICTTTPVRRALIKLLKGKNAFQKLIVKKPNGKKSSISSVTPWINLQRCQNKWSQLGGRRRWLTRSLKQQNKLWTVWILNSSRLPTTLSLAKPQFCTTTSPRSLRLRINGP